jgi:hypothetical protein
MAIDEHTNCLILQAGPAMNNSSETPNPVVYFLITDVSGASNAFTNTWFFAPQATKNQMLAVALAAMSAQLQVHIFVDTPNASNTTQCYNMYLLAP